MAINIWHLIGLGALAGSAIIAAIIVVWSKVVIPNMYPYTITLKEWANGRVLSHNTIGRILKKKKTADEFQVRGKLFKGMNIPIPPDKCVEIATRGRKYVMGYIVNGNTVIWGEDNLSMLKSEVSEETIKQDIQPITQNQRQLFVTQELYKERYKHIDWKSVLSAAAPAFALLIIFVVMFSFWSDITQPMLDAQKSQGEIIEKQTQMIEEMQTLAKIYQGIEVTDKNDETIIRGDLNEAET